MISKKKKVKYKVLIVEDAHFMRFMIKSILEEDDFIVIGEAENGIEGIRLYNNLKPDIVLMDITMPKMDGITATKKIVQSDPNAIIIMVSAMGQQKMIIEAMMAGAKNFIVKSFSQEGLISKIKEVIQENSLK